MSEYQPEKNSLSIKLVYYGPALSGKTTNLLSLHQLLAPELKADIMTLDTRNDRTLFFDLLPLGFRARSGLLVKFKLFTVPGQVQHDSTRKAVLSRSDGVVFVADSQRSQSVNNAESFGNLAMNAERVGLDFERLPVVVQFNKQDLLNVEGKEDLLERWCQARWPMVFASALEGWGVLETFSELLTLTYRSLDASMGLYSVHGVEEVEFLEAAMGSTVRAGLTDAKHARL